MGQGEPIDKDRHVGAKHGLEAFCRQTRWLR
jgi:hypothetical protein